MIHWELDWNAKRFLWKKFVKKISRLLIFDMVKTKTLGKTPKEFDKILSNFSSKNPIYFDKNSNIFDKSLKASGFSFFEKTPYRRNFKNWVATVTDLIFFIQKFESKTFILQLIFGTKKKGNLPKIKMFIKKDSLSQKKRIFCRKLALKRWMYVLLHLLVKKTYLFTFGP